MTYCFISIAGAPSPSWIKARQKSRSGPRHDSYRGRRTQALKAANATLKEGFAALAEMCRVKAVQMERQVRRGG